MMYYLLGDPLPPSSELDSSVLMHQVQVLRFLGRTMDDQVNALGRSIGKVIAALLCPDPQYRCTLTEAIERLKRCYDPAQAAVDFESKFAPAWR